MLKNKFIYSLLVSALLSTMTVSCTDDILDPGMGGEQEEEYPGYVLTFAMTLDHMGGGRSRTIEDDLSKIENYIDPHKVRVLFFDNQERFLFESKSRWIKKLDSSAGYDQWLVSVPFYPSGNDKDEYDWPWDEIRDIITQNSFKIVVLVNRPEEECYPDLAKSVADNRTDVFNFDNSGPNWTKHDVYNKKIIDLHHTQWDPIYTDKGMRALGEEPGFYQFVMDEDSTRTYRDHRMLMSSTSCWVDMGPLNNDKGDKYYVGSTSCRKWKHPSQDYPIPMYGVQNFDRITNWTRGTPFHLSTLTLNDESNYTHRTISLLRSVVKLELLIDKSLIGNNINNIQWLGHKYINIYARCEPIDVWTPTADLWEFGESVHSNGTTVNSSNCEWDLIMDYGAIARSGDKTGTITTPNLDSPTAAKKINDYDSFIQFRERISWLYGSWLDKGPDGKARWDFVKHGFTGDFAPPIYNANGTMKGRGYPHIFNPITQRNGSVYLDKSLIEDRGTYIYCAVYCGEQNINDPSDLFCMAGDGSGGGGKSPSPSWVLVYNNKVYSIPIMDHKGTNSYVYVYEKDYDKNALPNNGVTYTFQKHVYANYNKRDVLPWPLVRNHVYRIVLGTNGRSGEPTVVSSEHYSSPTISFIDKDN